MVYILGYNFSVAVWVGFIALYGIAVETGVVMVVYLHESLDKKLRALQKGEITEITKNDIYEATVEGSVLRLRPKLMTVATTMIGLVPVMWATYWFRRNEAAYCTNDRRITYFSSSCSGCNTNSVCNYEGACT